MPEQFDWAEIIEAAKEWMAENPERQPLWLVLPEGTSDEIADMATEIYDCPTIRDDIDKPWFTSIAPAAPVAGPLSPMNQPSGRRFSELRLVEMAERGQLTAEDIGKLTMEEYAQVRSILLGQVHRATRGNPLGYLKKM